MTKYLLTAIIPIFAVINSFSQYRSGYIISNLSEEYVNFIPISYEPATKVKKIDFEIKFEDPKKTERYTRYYNDSGKITDIYRINDPNDTLPYYLLEYNDNDKLMNLSRFNKKGELYRKIVYERNAKGIPLDYKQYNSKNKIITHDTWVFNNDSLIKENIHYKKGSDKIWSRFVYDYDENKKRIRSTLYNGKGKLRKTWSYECNEQGTKLEKIKDEVQICQWDSITANYLIKVYQSFDEKGNITKTITKYDISDTTLLERAMYDKNDSLVFVYKYDHDFRKQTYYAFYSNGIKKSENINKYENGILVYSASYYKGKQLNESIYKYENGLQTYRSSTSKGQTISVTERKYNDKDLLVEEKYTFKDKLKKTISLTY